MIKQKYLNNVQAGLILTKAWADPEFKKRLETDPTKTVIETARTDFNVELEHAVRVIDPPDDLTIEPLLAPSAGAMGTVAFTGACLVFTKAHTKKGSEEA